MDRRRVPLASVSDIWRVPLAVWRARKALDRGDLARARALVAPLLDRGFGSVTLVRKAAAEVLYASGDPLSAASLFERAAKRLPHDHAIAVGLVASYAALNRGGDARRASAMRSEDVDVRLALAWSELVATGGDRDEGKRIVTALAAHPDVALSPERLAMRGALDAIVAASLGGRDDVRAKLRAAERHLAKLRPADRAFLGYLGGVALRDAGLLDDARATFTSAMEASPEAIGAALARRERASLPG